ncbi:MAG: divalent metal cation transporter [Bacteroidota bacterium]
MQNELFQRAQKANFFGKLYLYAKLSGPGWVQAAVTLGGGTLVGALYLGVVGGYQFLWLQPLAMLCGIIMLSAISYVTLSKDNTEDRPFVLAKKHVSPVLAWGWLAATIVADVVFCAAQFALGADAVQGNLGGTNLPPFLITGILFIVGFFLIYLFSGEGRAAKIIDTVIKFLVAVIVLAFMGVVVVLMWNNAVNWSGLLSGLIPDFSALFRPTDSYAASIEATGRYSGFWNTYISESQRNIIIGAFGTAVGINMTFLLPYSLMKKGWKKEQRELSRFDLVLGLLIPFILGASALIISTASQFHAQKDGYVSEAAYHQVLDARLKAEYTEFATFDETRIAQIREAAPQADKDLSVMLAKRNANDLANALKPFLGDWSQLIFGIGILAMSLSTMLVHMMMNGYAVSEAFGQPGQRKLFLIGAVIPAIAGFFSPLIWNGAAKTALAVPASVIATTLLPIAYLIFLLLMNSKKALGGELPKNRLLVNILLFGATGIATFASVWALLGKYQSANVYDHRFGLIGLIGLPILAAIGIIGFLRKEVK